MAKTPTKPTTANSSEPAANQPASPTAPENSNIDSRSAELDAREKALDTRAQSIQSAERDLQNRATALDNLAAGLKAREDNLVAQATALAKEQENTTAILPEEKSAAPAKGLQRVTIIGPKKGRWRAGRHFGAEPVTLDLSTEDLEAVKADPVLSVSVSA